MPEMDGFTCTQELRKREKLKGGHVPIIAMTANAFPDATSMCLSYGMDDYISKPVKLESLKKVISKWLR
jgi:CheY-like chemotaxis protein